MQCSNCAHWQDKSKDDWAAKWSGLGKCGAVRERWNVLDEATADRKVGWAEGEDDWDEYGGQPPPENSWTGVRMAALREAKAVVADGSDYHAALLTGPTFFCALFKQKTETA